jgi:hypothetical protein
MTFPIIAPEDGDLIDPAWAELITDAVNDHEDRVDTIEATSGIVAYGNRTTDTGNITTTETGCVRLDSIPMISGYRYMVSVSGRPYSSVSTDTYKARFRMDTTGAAATTASTLLGTTFEMDQAHNCTHWATYTPGSNQTVSILFTLIRAVGSGNVKLNGDNFFEMKVENLGLDPGDTGVDI